MKKLKLILKLLRIKHYLKNFLVFIPLVFSNNLFQPIYFLRCFLGFLSFCLISSCIYILNDSKDIEKDKLHPTKKKRPLASGEISLGTAYTVLIILLIFVVGINLFLVRFGCGYLSFIYILIYFCLNVCYSYGFKNIPVIDIVILMLGFLIRVLYGAVIADTFVSSWLYLTVISGAFFFGLGKRRNELRDNEGGSTRGVLSYYNYDFLDKFMYLCLAMTNIFYALWAKEYENPHVIWTVPVMIVLFMQYSFDMESSSCDGDPVEVILKDRKLIAITIVLISMLFICIYFS